MKPDNAASEPCPSDLRLDTYCAGESEPAEYEALSLHIANCERCQYEVEMRGQGFAAFGGTEQAYLARFRNRIDEHDRVRHRQDPSPAKGWSSWLFGWKPAVCALVTAGVALMVVVRPTPSPDVTPTQNARTQVNNPQIRAKGGPNLKVFVSRQGVVEPVADNARLQAGDKLRFRVSLAQTRHIMLVGQEQSGQLYPIATSAKQTSFSMPAGIEQTLDQAIELDNSQGQEALHLVSCGSPFEFGQVSFTDKELESPEGCEISSLVFEKVPAPTP